MYIFIIIYNVLTYDIYDFAYVIQMDKVSLYHDEV